MIHYEKMRPISVANLDGANIITPELLNKKFNVKSDIPGEDVLSWVRSADNNLTQWIIDEINEHNGSTITCKKLLLRFERLCLYLLEEADWLEDFTPQDKAECRRIFEQICSRLSVYKHAVDLISKENQESAETYVEKILTKMQLTGYLYHANHAFNTLIAIFKLKPDLMEKDMPQLIDIILMSSKEQWQNDELRPYVVKLLDFYIKTISDKIDWYVSFDGKQEQNQLRTIIQALCIELILYKNDEGVNYDVNRAKLCRYFSFNQHTKQDNLLHNAVIYLKHGNKEAIPFKWDQIKHLDHAAILSSQRSIICQEKVDLQYSGATTLQMDNTGISLFPINGKKEKMVKVLPPTVLPWQNVQIYLDSLPSQKIGVGTTDFSKLKLFWGEVENSLYKARKPEVKNKRRRPMVGEEAFIIIDKLIDPNKGIFHCKIDTVSDDMFVGEGTICIKDDIVGYTIKPMYIDMVYHNGFLESKTQRPYIFYATIKSDEGGLQFAMNQWIEQKWAEDEKYSNGYETNAVVTFVHPLSGQIICVAEEGFTVQIEESDEPLKQGDYIKVSIWGSKQTAEHGVQAIGTYIGHSAKEVTQQNALCNLLKYYAEDVWEPSSNENVIKEEAEVENTNTIKHEEVVELVRQIDRATSFQKEAQIRYNFLELAKIMSHLIGNQKMETYYQTRLEHQKILQDFATNNTISNDVIRQLETIDDGTKSQFPTLALRLAEIKALSCYGKPEANAALFAGRGQITNDRLRKITDLVLAYNLLGSFEMPTQKKEILDEINKLLQVKLSYIDAKHFGEEDNHTEFKTSIVYIANEEGKILPDLENQMAIILKVICSFLNSEGGSLYLGVNDVGMGVGLQDDLTWFASSATHKDINSKDAYLKFITSAIVNAWPKEAHLVSISSVDAKGRFVVQIKVSPCEKPLSLADTYYYRIGSECRKITPESLPEFMARRSQQYQQYIASQNNE